MTSILVTGSFIGLFSSNTLAEVQNTIGSGVCVPPFNQTTVENGYLCVNGSDVYEVTLAPERFEYSDAFDILDPDTWRVSTINQGATFIDNGKLSMGSNSTNENGSVVKFNTIFDNSFEVQLDITAVQNGGGTVYLNLCSLENEEKIVIRVTTGTDSWWIDSVQYDSSGNEVDTAVVSMGGYLSETPTDDSPIHMSFHKDNSVVSTAYTREWDPYALGNMGLFSNVESSLFRLEIVTEFDNCSSCTFEIDDFRVKQLESAPEGTVYRFFNVYTGAHLYTASIEERDELLGDHMLRMQWKYEGAKYIVHMTQIEGTVPVYRFFNTVTGTHLYTISEKERDAIISTLPQFDFEGIKYYVNETQIEGTKPVYRFFNTINGAHLYTDSTHESNTIIQELSQFTFEGIKFYVQEL